MKDHCVDHVLVIVNVQAEPQLREVKHVATELQYGGQ